MAKPANRSILTMAFVLVVIALFAWNFNRKMLKIKSSKAPRPEPSASSPGPGPNLPVLACFCSDWNYLCGQAKELIGEVSARYKSRLEVRLIDPASEPELARKFKVAVLPTFVFFDGRGKLVLRKEGPMTEREVLEVLGQMGLGSQEKP